MITIYGTTYATFLFLFFTSTLLSTNLLWSFKNNNNIIRFFYYALLCIGVTFVISYIFIVGKIIATIDYEVDANQYDYVIVLGAGLHGDKISLVLEERLKKCLEIVDSNPNITVIVSGGQGEGEWISEALAMKRFLVLNSVSETQILIEEESTTTNENLLLSSKLIDVSESLRNRVLIITNDFHLYRALKIANRMGLEADGVSSKTDIVILANYLAYEYMANLKDILLSVR